MILLVRGATATTSHVDVMPGTLDIGTKGLRFKMHYCICYLHISTMLI